MSTLDVLESSEESSQPIELFRFVIGNETFRYTSSEDTISYMGNDYLPEGGIQRNEVVLGPDERDRVVRVRVPVTNSFAQKYINVVPGKKATLTITQLQRNEPGFATAVVRFKGFIAGVDFPGDSREAVIGVRSIESFASQPVPRYVYSILCNHFLFDEQCQVPTTGFMNLGTVSAVDANTITVPGLSGRANGFFTAGFVKPTDIDDFRLVISHTGDDLVLLLPFPFNMVGQDVTVFAGCDHDVNGDCSTKFANTPQHGGWPFIPRLDPFRTDIT